MRASLDVIDTFGAGIFNSTSCHVNDVASVNGFAIRFKPLLYFIKATWLLPVDLAQKLKTVVDGLNNTLLVYPNGMFIDSTVYVIPVQKSAATGTTGLRIILMQFTTPFSAGSSATLPPVELTAINDTV